MAIMCSVDFDFWFVNRAEAGEKSIRRSWQNRYAALRRVGLDPLEAAPLSVTPSFDLFAQTLARSAERMEDAPLLTSDSHAFGVEVAQTAMGVFGRRRPLDRIVHFDAHHDLGYGGAVRDWQEKRLADCGTWLFAALDAGFAKGADVIYPDWRVVPEQRPDHAAWKSVRRRVKFYTWSEWLAARKTYGRVAATHLCHSSAWTPPWHDGAFEVLAAQLRQLRRRCLDCAPGGQRIGDHDSCKPRAWDREAAEAYTTATMAEATK